MGEEEGSEMSEGDKNIINNSTSEGGSSNNNTNKARSCKGCLYYSSQLKAKHRNPLCVGFGRALQQVPNYVEVGTDIESSNEGRSLEDFKYACVGYSAYASKKDSPTDQHGQTELPYCVGIELLVDRRPSTVAPVREHEHAHRKEDTAVLPRPPLTHRPPHTIGDEFFSSFSLALWPLVMQPPCQSAHTGSGTTTGLRSEVLSSNETQKAIFWYQRTVDRHVDPFESSKMLNWTNKAIKSVHDRLQSQESILAEMEKTLKAIELHRKGDISSALRLLNTQVDDVTTHMKKVDKSLENTTRYVSTCPDIPKIVSKEVIDVVQPLISQSEDTRKDIASKLGTTHKIVQNSLHQLHESTVEISQKVDQVQEHVSPIPEIIPQTEKILDNTKKPEEFEPDWSHKVSWSEVANSSGSSTCHKIVLL
ncbi:hypothetical protein KI387_007827 [Taxus chinensis]|uniref:DUF8204 domain-containing protein n=1 Tax=Taxus chinensis TaxID=29808 RepID=A0AA38LKX2_TAXCH|nr:hypothetical protein KI387_007827 [Taxus chinensis]